MSAAGRGAVRNPDDYYQTPAWCVDRLLEAAELPGGCWLEPCAGSGAIVRAVNARRHDVVWSAWEINEGLETHAGLASCGADFCGRDFLEAAGNIEIATPDVILTNPPYSRASEFVEACLPLARHVIMLLRLNWLGGAKRAAFLRRHPPDVFVLPNRPSFTGGGTDATEYAWFHWPGAKRRARGDLHVLAETSRKERCP